MEISQEIRDIAEVIRQAVPAEQIYLFGSYAYGEPNEHSDYDFYVVIPDDSMRSMEAMQRAQVALLALRNIPAVDVLARHKSKFEQMREWKSTVDQDVAMKGVLLYERAAA
ncbi:MAG: nucleotidyltransferase domain-containing protein [Oscillospiraceae bacterium]|nr:nucleotidyltransferase domain-containing protein [Oscillospiraceae bacterium]